MSNHRSTSSTVQNDPHLDNLDTQDVVEALRAALLQVDTLAQLASNAVDQLHCPTGAADRRAFARMQILVGKVADEARAALTQSDEAIAALSRCTD